MRKIITFPTLIGIFFLIAGIAVGLILIQGTKTFKLGASPEAAPKDVRVTNITSTSFTISWITDASTSGFVKYGESQTQINQTALDELESMSQTHFARVDGLSAQKNYFIKINSEGNDYDNNGIPWSTQTTQQEQNNISPTIISGKIENESGAPVSGALVYVKAISLQLSSITTDDGSWLITLFQELDVNQNVLEIFVQSGQGVATAKAHPNAANPVPTIVLGQVHDFTNLSLAQGGNVPEAQIELPQEATNSPQSKFNVDASPSTQNTTVTLESHDNGEVVTTTSPEFFGEGPAGTSLTITVESDPITDTVRVDSRGIWQWSPPQELEPGTHTIKINYRDAGGILRTLTRSFIVQAAEGPAFESSSSATLSPTPTATPTATPKATATPSATPTASAAVIPIPDSGIPGPSLALLFLSFMAAVASIGFFAASFGYVRKN